jgi:hypothetical protein
MGVYDQAGRFATTAEPGFVLARLRPLIGLTLAWRRWLTTKSLPLPVFIYLAGSCPRSEVSVQTPSGHGFVGKPPVWEVANDSAAETLARVASGEYPWGALFWTVLMPGAEEDVVIDLWRRLRDDKVPPKHRGDVTNLTLVFADLVGRHLAWERVKEEVKMTESPYANSLTAEARLNERRESLREVIRARFPEALTPDVERAIAAQPSLTLLRDWLTAAAAARAPEDFLAALRR